jgi:S1-C subfamily serine protease
VEATGGWTCPECERRVPPGVDVCRCGATRELATSFVPDPEPSGGVSPTLIWVGALAILAAGGVWLWLTVSLPAPTPSPGAADTLPGGDAAPRPTGPAVARTTEVAPTSESMAEAAVPGAAAAPGATSPAHADAPPAASPAAARPADSGSGSIGLEDLVARTGGAVVMIEAGQSRGTGFFVGSDLLVTNDHVVGGATAVTIRLNDGSTRSARVERTVPDVDLALLRTAGGAAPAVLPLGQIAAVRTGQEVIAIGSALGLQNTVTRGIVSARRQVGSIVLLQTDAAINPGNSGGPLIDRQGVVIGVTTLKMGGAAEGLGFAVAADHVAALVEGRASAIVARAAGAPPVPAGQPAASSALQGFGSDGAGVDARRTEATQIFERDLAALAQQAAQVDAYWQRFTAACAPRPRNAGDREWFGLAEGRVDYAGRDHNCPYWLNDMTSMSRDFGDAMRKIGESARRSGVYPGTLREVRRRHRLDWTGFDR